MFDYSILESEFDIILEKRIRVSEKYKTLETKMVDMNHRHNYLIQNNPKKIFIYCLDSFFFQYKILLLELDYFDKVTKAVFNRMYRDYYKLFTEIVESCKNSAFEINSIPRIETIIFYSDVCISVEYNTEDLSKLHVIIVSILKQLSTHYDNQCAILLSHDKGSNIGFSITIFLDALCYENRLLYEKINLYNSYLQFYHSSQNGYLDKILGNMETLGSNIDNEVLVNHNTVRTESKTKFNIIKRKFNSGTLLDILKNIEVVKNSETYEVEKIQETDKVVNGEQSIQVEKIQETIEILNGEQSIQVEKISDTIEVEKIQETDEVVNGEQSIQVEKIQETDEVVNGEQSIQVEKIQETVEVVNGEQSIQVEKIQETIEVVNGEHIPNK